MAGRIAPIATALAAIMTAANLGARVTGWGFVVFAVGSVAWSVVGLSTGQMNLLWTNGFLTLVNFVGIWRWLGRRVRYEDGGQQAVAASVHGPAPTVLAVTTLPDMPVRDRHGRAAGTVVEGLVECDTGRVATIVVRRGGIAGIGERLIAVDRRHLSLRSDHIALDLATTMLDAMPTWEPTAPRRRPTPTENTLA